MNRNNPKRLLVVCAACLALSQALAAQAWHPDGYFVQGGAGDDRTWNATAGLTWEWGWTGSLLGTEVGGVTEVYLSHWSAPSAAGRRSFTQIGVVPMFRFRFDAGRSAWFAEAGVGLSAMDQRFVTTYKQMSTSFNFVDVLGVGRKFGTGGTQEIGLRLQHLSNAGIKLPNPGQNFWQLRYAAAF